MTKRVLTREFSICLLPTDDVIRDVQTLRQDLPASPYRDDIPHATLLRGITSNSDMSDEALAHDIDSILSITDSLPLAVEAESVANGGNQFYSLSGGILLRTSPELLAFRQAAAHKLEQHGYTVETQELNSFIPHITIRLGVPLEGDMLQRAQELFNGRAITFSQWLLFRLVKENGKRIMHEVRPLSA